MVICFVDLPELSRVTTVEDTASRSKQRFLMETSAIDSLSFSVIFLFLRDFSKRLRPSKMFVDLHYKIGGNEQKKSE